MIFAVKSYYPPQTMTVRQNRDASRADAPGNAVTGEAAARALPDPELDQLKALQSRDREVRAHEAAHQAAAGNLSTGGASFSYQRGPDGRLYAIGGEVHIDTSAVSGDPKATLRKAETVIRATLAPARPSSQDRQVAARAVQMAAEARTELALKNSRQVAERFVLVEDFERFRTPRIDVTA